MPLTVARWPTAMARRSLTPLRINCPSMGAWLLALPEAQQTEAARTIVAKGLSVRQTEALVRSLLAAKDKGAQKPAKVDPNVAELQQWLAERLGAGVDIQYNKKGKGKVVISYNSFEELDGILAHIQ